MAQIPTLDTAVRVLAWLAAAVVAHDLVLWPLYSSADAVGRRALGARVAYVRVPAALSLCLALAFLPALTGKGEAGYRRASGQGWDGYVTRWLVVTLVLFALSALLCAWRQRG